MSQTSSLTETLQTRREAGEGLDRGLPHRPALVAHRDEERGDRLGAPRGAEVGHRPPPGRTWLESSIDLLKV